MENSDPDAAISYAVSDPIGEVIVDNVKNSITVSILQILTGYLALKTAYFVSINNENPIS